MPERYDIQKAWFKTPNGRSALMHIRSETNDWNTCNAAMTEDEYGLRDRSFSGSAIDIGGHLGAVTISLLVDNPDLWVETVEPIPENIDLIWKNAAINGVAGRLRVHEAAVGDGSAVTVRYAYTDNENDLHHAYIGNSLNTGDMTREHRTAVVPTLTVRSFDSASFVKIDCEGGEWPFFASGSAKKFPYIVGEWHPTGHTRDELFGLLPDHDITFTGPEGGPGGFTAILKHVWTDDPDER
jgi:FkbM family methyltransferase